MPQIVLRSGIGPQATIPLYITRGLSIGEEEAGRPIDRSLPVVPETHANPAFHRRLIANRVNQFWFELGEWTPALEIGGSTSGVTYTARSGYYHRVGDIVFVKGWLNLSANGSETGDITISGLPFTPQDGLSGTTVEGGGGVSYSANMASLSSAVIAAVEGSEIALYDVGATGHSALTEANVTSTTQIAFSVTYLASR